MVSWEEVGDGCFRRHYEFLDQNIGAVIGGDGVLVVDTRSTLSQADELAEDLKGLTDLPVRWVVNTHYHWDHTFGNSRFRVPIWGHVACRRQLRTAAEAVKSELAGQPELAAISAELARVEVVAPNHALARHSTIDVGDRRVELEYLGRAHTDSDIVVRVPDSGVVYAGDLVEEGAPPSYGDSYPAEWPVALLRLAALPEGVVVPGHGRPVDRSYVEHQRLEIMAAIRAIEEGTPGPYPDDVMAEVAERLDRYPVRE